MSESHQRDIDTSFGVSVCMPNFNYGRFLTTALTSVLDQGDALREVVFVDNASTDDSVAVARELADDRVRIVENAANIGFTRNLSRAVTLANAPWAMVVSSDDALRPGALDVYRRTVAGLDELGMGQRALLTASTEIFDDEDRVTGQRHRPGWLWDGVEAHAALSEAVGAPVYVLDASIALRRSVEHMRNPAYFVSAMFPRALVDELGGYFGGHLMNPDKGFHWRLLARSDWLVYIDEPLASYRVHGAQQNEQQKKAKVLKHLVDEYCYTFELEGPALERAGLERDQVVRAFVHHDVALRGLQLVAHDDRATAARHLAFGIATYPRQTLKDRSAYQLAALLAAGPIGTKVAARLYERRRTAQLGPSQLDTAAARADTVGAPSER